MVSSFCNRIVIFVHISDFRLDLASKFSTNVIPWSRFQEKESVSLGKFERTVKRLGKLNAGIPLRFLYYDKFGYHITIATSGCLDHAMDQFRNENVLKVEVRIAKNRRIRLNLNG
jgi:hypothetical protein